MGVYMLIEKLENIVFIYIRLNYKHNLLFID